MLQVGTKLNISDNSGAKKVECIKILGRHSFSPGTLGDLIVVSVKRLRSKGNLRVKRKDVCFGLIFRIKYRTSRVDGRSFNFFNNSVILLNKNLKPYGTRFFGPVVKELRKQKKLKLSFLGSNHF